jgi:hypothetical protein
MNERIQTLLAKFKETESTHRGDHVLIGLDEIEKFAELVVKECAELCEGEAIFAGSNGRKDASASNCSTIIRKHFGVEE